MNRLGLGATLLGCLLAMPAYGQTEAPKVYATIEDNSISCIDFSSDGKTLAYCSGDKGIKLWDVGSRKIRARFEKDDYPNQNLTFAPDAKKLYFDSGRQVVRFDLDTGRMTNLFRCEDNADFLQFAKD